MFKQQYYSITSDLNMKSIKSLQIQNLNIYKYSTILWQALDKYIYFYSLYLYSTLEIFQFYGGKTEGGAEGRRHRGSNETFSVPKA